MNNEKAIATLEEIKTYVNSHSLDALDYAIQVLVKLEESGISNPLDENITISKVEK